MDLSGRRKYLYVACAAPGDTAAAAPMLTLVMGLSAALAASRITGLSAGIKWPNDVVLEKKKICGILTEMSVQAEYVDYVVIGVGINVNH